MNLKDRKLQEAKTKLTALEEKLKFLEFSNLQDKEEKIIVDDVIPNIIEIIDKAFK